MALMTLLEGHADHVMDAVGPSVVPSRGSPSGRRSPSAASARAGPIDRLLRALLGLDMKLAQYVKGGAFVGAVVDQVGMAGVQRGLDVARRRCRPAPRSPIRRPGSRRVLG